MKTKDDARLKSWFLLLAGLAGMAYQQYTGEVSWPLLLIFTLMTGVPGGAYLISLIKNSPIVLQSSVSPEPPLELDLDKSSQKLPEDKP